jgi:hypothetical protein
VVDHAGVPLAIGSWSTPSAAGDDVWWWLLTETHSFKQQPEMPWTSISRPEGNEFCVGTEPFSDT